MAFSVSPGLILEGRVSAIAIISTALSSAGSRPTSSAAATNVVLSAGGQQNMDWGMVEQKKPGHIPSDCALTATMLSLRIFCASRLWVLASPRASNKHELALAEL